MTLPFGPRPCRDLAEENVLRVAGAAWRRHRRALAQMSETKPNSLGEAVKLHGHDLLCLLSRLPTGHYSGNTVTSWLSALHMADVFGLPYRIFVCVLGLLITMLSATGVYIWWRKRAARKSSARRTGPEDAKAMAASLTRRSFEAWPFPEKSNAVTEQRGIFRLASDVTSPGHTS